MMELAAHVQDLKFNENQIDANVENVPVTNDCDMIVAICYIAECLTIGRPIDFVGFDVGMERDRVADHFIRLL